jgi:hypothetical protein
MFQLLQGTPAGQSILGSIPPDVAQQFIQQQQIKTNLANAKTATETIQQGAAGGGMPDLQQLSGWTGLQFYPTLATSVQAGLARSAGQQPHSAFSIPISIDPDKYGRDPATMKAWTTQVRITGDPTIDEKNKALAEQQLISLATGAKSGGPQLQTGGTTTNLPPANPQGDMNPATNPLLGPLPGIDTGGTQLPFAQRDPGKSGTLAAPPAPTGGGAQAAPVTPPKPPANVRPANMPDTNRDDKTAWQSDAGQATQRRAQLAMASLPPQVRQYAQLYMAKNGYLPVAVQGNVAHFVGPGGEDLGMIP